MKRAGNTGREMVESGAWVKVGRKHYRHIDGAEIRYNCNRWVWEIVGTGEAYTLLWVARHRAERAQKTYPMSRPDGRLVFVTVPPSDNY